MSYFYYISIGGQRTVSFASRLLQLAVEADGVVLPRRPRRRHRAPRQEPEEMVGRPSLQRPAPEGLHASRGLAAGARRHGEEDEEEQGQDVPPELRR